MSPPRRLALMNGAEWENLTREQRDNLWQFARRSRPTRMQLWLRADGSAVVKSSWRRSTATWWVVLPTGRVRKAERGEALT